jgi:hypothetical protein
MGLGAHHLEKTYENIQRVANSKENNFTVVFSVHGGSVREMSLIDPALVLDNSLSFES